MPFRKHLKSRYPAANVPRRNEPVAMDYVISDTPAYRSGVTKAAFFEGRESHVMDAYPIRSEKQAPKVTEDNIRQRGAPTKLISDNAKSNVSQRMKDLLRLFHIQDYQSEPHNQQQNFAENGIGKAKNVTNRVMDRTGCPASYWLLCLLWVITVMNYTAAPSLDWKIPLTVLTGSTTDISILL